MTTKKKTSFAEAFKEVEDIAAWFEGNEVDVDEGLKKFERGAMLAKQCKERLTEAEVRVREILLSYNEGAYSKNEDNLTDEI